MTSPRDLQSLLSYLHTFFVPSQRCEPQYLTPSLRTRLGHFSSIHAGNSVTFMGSRGSTYLFGARMVSFGKSIVYDRGAKGPGIANGEVRFTPKSSRSSGHFRGIMAFC